MTNEQIQAFRECGESCQRALAVLVEVLRPVMDEITKFVKALYAWMKESYHAAGAIYGDTDEGMQRWFEEVLTIGRLRQQAEYLEQRHLMLAEIRTMRL
jgi:hypothetical protein